VDAGVAGELDEKFCPAKSSLLSDSRPAPAEKRFQWSDAFGKGSPHNEAAAAALEGYALRVSIPASEAIARSPGLRRSSA
jgi:hypothetical protein